MVFKKEKIQTLELENRDVDISNGLDARQIEDRINKGFINEIKVGTSNQWEDFCKQHLHLLFFDFAYLFMVAYGGGEYRRPKNMTLW